MRMQTAKGVRDLAPEEKIKKNEVVDRIKTISELCGFVPLETPVIERYETLSAKFGAGTESDALKETFKFTDQGKRKLGLRFEFTTSLARYIASNPTLKLPFKRYQVGPNFRDGPIKLGRERQFWQFDLDVVGSDSVLADAELVGIVYDVFKKLDLKIVIKINNRKLLNGILNQAGIKNIKEAIIAIDKLDKIGENGVTQELLKSGYSKKQINQVFSLIKKNVKIRELKSKVTDKEGLEGIKELETLFSYLDKMNIKYTFEVSLARGQAYYTGTVIEAFFQKSKVSSSIAAGGRYDKMIGGFIDGKREIPAVGISFGLTPIMEELRKTFDKKTLTKVYVIPINTVDESLQLAKELRLNGINTEISLAKKGVSKNLQYASALGIPYVIILGEKEMKKKKLLLRDMQSGVEQLLTLNQAVKKLK